MTERWHTHPCARCGNAVPCPGEWERNHDGWPEAICDVYHARDGGVTLCEDCDAASDGCNECGMVLGSTRSCDTCQQHRHYVGD